MDARGGRGGLCQPLATWHHDRAPATVLHVLHVTQALARRDAALQHHLRRVDVLANAAAAVDLEDDPGQGSSGGGRRGCDNGHDDTDGPVPLAPDGQTSLSSLATAVSVLNPPPPAVDVKWLHLPNTLPVDCEYSASMKGANAVVDVSNCCDERGRSPWHAEITAQSAMERERERERGSTIKEHMRI